MELTVEQTLQQGVAAHKEGKFQEAERLYRAILQIQSTHPDANHNLGVLAVSLNNPEAALPLFKIALQINPKIEYYWDSYIDALIRSNQFTNAKKVLKRAKKTGLAKDRIAVISQKIITATTAASPSQEEINNLLGHYQSGRYKYAENVAISFSRQFPGNNFSWKILAAVLRQTGRISEALVANQKAVEINPKDAAAHSNLGVMLQELGELEDAEASCRQAIALKPNFADAHSNLGITLRELGRREEAEPSYRKAIALKPDYAEAYSNLGNTLRELGTLAESKGRYQQAIMLNPHYAQAHSNMGATLVELGRQEEAEASYRQALALKPDYVEAHCNLGVALRELGRLEEAEEKFNQAIVIKPDYGEAFINRGQLLFDKGKFEGALRDFDICNTSDSRARALTSLYALGRIDDIYKRIEMQPKLDDKNIRIAAITSFLAEREKKETAHKYCKNPIAFLHISNISSHVGNAEEFITGLIKELLNINTNWEPLNRTTRNGFQSKVNLFRSPLMYMKGLMSLISDEIDLYYAKFDREQCTFIEKWPEKKNLYGWHVILKQQGYQTAHIHPSGWLSGVIYLKVVPSLGKDEGAIEFSLNGPNYSDLHSPTVMHQPRIGDIVLFPSSLHHRTVPFTTDTDRIVLSFDLMPKIAKD
jgi:tetratricopeptide (TPR) repeat protein